jgi:porin
MQYSWNNMKGDPNLAGSFKFGAWQNFGTYNDLRYAVNGVSLASPMALQPATLHGDSGVWAIFEQQIYRVPKSDDRGIGMFTRLSGSPAAASLIDLYADAGIEFIGINDARPDDKFGIAVGYAHVARRAQELDSDFAILNRGWPRRSFEGLLTAVYQFQVREGWTIQPNFQYIIHPGGGASDPLGTNPGRLLRNASVFGLRTVVKF